MANSRKECSVDSCGRPSLARGYCSRHWKRWSRHGDPEAGGNYVGAGIKFFEETVIPFEGASCLAWPYSKSNKGYGIIFYRGRNMHIGRAVCFHFFGEPEKADMEAAHSCGNGHLGCCSPKHLRWATHKENMEDRDRHGTVRCGEAHPCAKVTDEQVQEIRALKGAQPLAETAIRFGISLSTASSIQNFKHRVTVGRSRDVRI